MVNQKGKQGESLLPLFIFIFCKTSFIFINIFSKYVFNGEFMAKGSDFERNISRFLTKWLTGKTKPYMFWRSDASGGLATMHEENVHMTGDIKNLHPDSQFLTDIFSIECKNGYPSTSFWQHFNTTKFGIENFWLQSIDDATKAGKHPMLIYRKKGRRIIVGIDKYIQEKLNKRLKGLNYIGVCWGSEDACESCFLYDMQDFFDRVKPDDIRRLHGNT